MDVHHGSAGISRRISATGSLRKDASRHGFLVQAYGSKRRVRDRLLLITGIITTYLVLRLLVRRGFIDTYPISDSLSSAAYRSLLSTANDLFGQLTFSRCLHLLALIHF